MDASRFIAKWRRADLTERSASQQHFLDLCELFDHPKLADADPAGDWFTFEKGAHKHAGGEGWADVWKKGFFGWEYKGRHKDLKAASKLDWSAVESAPPSSACSSNGAWTPGSGRRSGPTTPAARTSRRSWSRSSCSR